MPASSVRRSMSSRMVAGLTLRTATLDFAMGRVCQTEQGKASSGRACAKGSRALHDPARSWRATHESWTAPRCLPTIRLLARVDGPVAQRPLDGEEPVIL